jgi:hypothetical protein
LPSTIQITVNFREGGDRLIVFLIVSGRSLNEKSRKRFGGRIDSFLRFVYRGVTAALKKKMEFL